MELICNVLHKESNSLGDGDGRGGDDVRGGGGSGSGSHKDENPFARWFQSTNVRCTVSTRNQVAFSSNVLLGRPLGITIRKCSVYLADLNIPHQPHLLTTLQDEVSILEWDVSGLRLIVGDVTGTIQVWEARDQLLNDFRLIWERRLDGERPLCVAWFSDGIRTKIHLRNDSPQGSAYSSRFRRVKTGTSLKKIGGLSYPGFIVVTSSGLVSAVMLHENPVGQADWPIDNFVMSTEMLSAKRMSLQHVDLCYAKDGSFLLVVSDGIISEPISCFRVTLNLIADPKKQSNERLKVTCQPFNSFYLACSRPESAATTREGEHDKFTTITSLKYLSREASDSVIIAANGPTNSILELWKLKKQPIQVHQKFLKTTNSTSSPVTVKTEQKDTVIPDNSDEPEDSKDVQMTDMETKQAKESHNRESNESPNSQGSSRSQESELKSQDSHPQRFNSDGKPLNVNQAAPSDKPLETIKWQLHAAYEYDQRVTTLTRPNVSLFHSSTSAEQSFLIVSYANNSVQLFRPDDLHLERVVSDVTHPDAHRLHGEDNKHFVSTGHMHKGSFKAARTTTLMALELSWSGAVLIGFDAASQMFLYRLAHTMISSGSDSANSSESLLQHVQPLLEYFIFTGIGDPWDLIVSLNRPTQLEQLCRALTETFDQKLNPLEQDRILTRYLATVSSLFRCLAPPINPDSRQHSSGGGGSSSNGLSKAADFHTLSMLYSVNQFMKSLLRPRGQASMDKEGPADNLSTLIRNSSAPEQGQMSFQAANAFHSIDRLIQQLDHRDFIVESMTVQCMQPLHQWVADLCLFLVASIPQQCHNHVRFGGAGLAFDLLALNMLRECLVMMKMWGLINEAGLPSWIKMTENHDVLGHLYKLLSKVATCLRGGAEPDDNLLEECYLLANNILVPQLDLCRRAIGIASPALFYPSSPSASNSNQGTSPGMSHSNLHGQSKILSLQYYKPATALRYSYKLHTVDGTYPITDPARIAVDVVRHINLGGHLYPSRNLRTCTRCGAVSLGRIASRLPVKRAWEQKWTARCPCGGYWRLIRQNWNTSGNISSPSTTFPTGLLGGNPFKRLRTSTNPFNSTAVS